MGDLRTYRIREVRDFLDVPEDRLEECLREFGLWVALAREMRTLLDGVPILNDPTAVFGWVDDGKGELTVTVSTPDGQEVHREVFSGLPTTPAQISREGEG
jgi:hypothetical protein